MAPQDGTESLASRIVRSAPARLVVELAAALGVIIGGHVATKALVGALSIPHGAYFAVFLAVDVPPLVLVHRLLVRLLERRALTELALIGAWRESGRGLVIGAALFTTTIALIGLLGGYGVSGVASPRVLLAPLCTAVAAGFTEELLARGVVFRIVEEWLGTWAALVLSSALFGLAHLGNSHATVWSAIAIALEAGTMLGAAFMVTRRLWLAVGIHVAWNFTQGAVFGVAVSGGASKGLLEGVTHGPEWLTGGEFGAEASVVAVLVCSTGAALLLARAVKAGRVVPPPWARRPGAVTAASA
jgi:membrane protease YdiL (CAAX protease family)